MTMLDELYDQVLPEMAAAGIEDTIPNRITMLTGIVKVWEADTTDNCIDKSLWISLVKTEISMLNVRASTARIRELTKRLSS